MNLLHRKGRLILSSELATKPDLKLMKAIFSVFYPVAMQSKHEVGFYDSILYYGYSENFREIEEGAIIPLYQVVAEKNGDSLSVTFNEIITS